VLFRDRSVLDTAFRIGAPYMRDDDGVPNLGERGVQGTRRADVLKLWLTLQHLGRQGVARLVDESDRLTAYLTAAIDDRDALTLASRPETNVVCFRATPDWCAPDEYDALNDRLQESLLREAGVFVSLPTYRGSRWLRVVLLNPYTDTATLDRLLGHVDRTLGAERDA
jgi:glutamate/tyrosine decarboxylase-like PLP-dependent enzyme